MINVAGLQLAILDLRRLGNEHVSSQQRVGPIKYPLGAVWVAIVATGRE